MVLAHGFSFAHGFEEARGIWLYFTIIDMDQRSYQLICICSSLEIYIIHCTHGHGPKPYSPSLAFKKRPFPLQLIGLETILK